MYTKAGGDGVFQKPAADQEAVRAALEAEARRRLEAQQQAPVVSPSGETFRKRRLSIGVIGVPGAEDKTPQAAADAAAAAAAAKDSRRRRPSLEFRSPDYPEASSTRRSSKPNNKLTMRPTGATKAAVEQTTKAPYPDAILGTWSYHGIEPGFYGRGTVAKINQDRGCVVHPYADSDDRSLICVFDGHGQDGQDVSEFAVEHIVELLEEDPLLESDPKAALIRTFTQTDDLLRRSTIESYYSGSTAVVVYRDKNRLYTANVGDSRAIVARRVPGKSAKKKPVLEAVALSIDHNPDLPSERQRIESSGGYVSDPPEDGLSARVWLDAECTQVGLAMARSIGDHAVAAVGVFAEPEVRVHDLVPEDEFLIAASDGVWEFITSAEAVAVVEAALKAANAKEACNKLMKLAIDRWAEMEGDYRDDITCIVLKLQMCPDAAAAPNAPAN